MAKRPGAHTFLTYLVRTAPYPEEGFFETQKSPNDEEGMTTILLSESRAVLTFSHMGKSEDTRSSSIYFVRLDSDETVGGFTQKRNSPMRSTEPREPLAFSPRRGIIPLCE